MLAREEEVKRRAVIQKEIFAGPQIRFRSREGDPFLSHFLSVSRSLPASFIFRCHFPGKNTLEFTLVTSVPKEINAKAPPCKDKIMLL